MKRKTILTIILIFIIGIFQLGCSQESDSITIKTISFDTSNYIVRDSVRISPAFNFTLALDKDRYHLRENIKISFRIDDPPVFDASFSFKIIFPNEEKLGIEIYKDSSLIYKYPLQLINTNTPDTLFLPVILLHNWNQIDNDSKQVEVGEYTIKAYLLHNDYSKFVQQKKFIIIN